MDKTKFLEYANKKYTSKSSSSRLYRVAKAEALIGTDLDEIVANDEDMFLALQSIDTGKVKNDYNLKNALRNYYEFRNGKSFVRESAFANSCK